MNATTSRPSLTGALIKLQLKLQWRQIRASTGMMIGSLIMLVVVLSAVIPLVYLMAALRSSSLETRGVVTALGFAVLTLGWPLAVTFMTGNNDMLDAGRFALFPVRGRQLLPGLLVAAGLGLGGVLTVLLGVGYVLLWSGSGLSLVTSLIGLVLGFATCLVSSRALSALLAAVLRRRRARDLLMVVLVVGILLLSMAFQVLPRLIGGQIDSGVTISLAQVIDALTPAANIAAWTPFGWAWALPWAVAGSDWGTALVWLILALVWLAFCSWVWMRQFSQALTSPLEAGGGAQKIAKANPIDRYLPDTKAGAVAKRDLRYWRRDPRRLVGAIAVLIMPVIMGAAMWASSTSAPADQTDTLNIVWAFSPVMIGFMASISLAYDISYDGTALATQIVTGISGRDDRWGRALAYMVIFVPIQLVYVLIFMALSHHWELLPAVIGCCLAWFGSGVGLGSWLGAVWQIPQPPAGSNLATRSGTGGVGGFLSAMLGMILPMVVCLPVIALAVVAVAFGQPYGWLTLLAGALEAWLIIWWGVRAGGRRLDKTWPEVLARVTWKG